MKYKTCYNVHELQNQYDKGNGPDPIDRQDVVLFHIPEMSRQGKSTEIGSIPVVAWGWKRMGNDFRCKWSFGDDEAVLKLRFQWCVWPVTCTTGNQVGDYLSL